MAPFDEAREAVEAAYLRARSEAAVREFLDAARQRSDIRVEVRAVKRLAVPICRAGTAERSLGAALAHQKSVSYSKWTLLDDGRGGSK